MAIAVYEPEKRNEVIKRRQARRAIEPPKGAKRIGEWSVIGGGKVFMLIDVEDPIEIIPVIVEKGVSP